MILRLTQSISSSYMLKHKLLGYNINYILVYHYDKISIFSNKSKSTTWAYHKNPLSMTISMVQFMSAREEQIYFKGH